LLFADKLHVACFIISFERSFEDEVVTVLVVSGLLFGVITEFRFAGSQRTLPKRRRFYFSNKFLDFRVIKGKQLLLNILSSFFELFNLFAYLFIELFFIFKLHFISDFLVMFSMFWLFSSYLF